MGSDLVARSEEALIAAAMAGIDTADMVIPMLKVAQSLSHSVRDGDAEPGDLVHSLTSETYGNSVRLIIVDQFKGRSMRVRETGKFFAANRTAVIPEDWPVPGAGEMHFVDNPESEEKYRERVNDGEIEWGQGPKIATTYNFVGLVVNEEGEVEGFPVRVSLSRSSAKEGRNWQTMLAINRAPWDNVYELSTSPALSKRNEPFVAVKIKQVRKTTAEEKALALTVAELIHSDVNVSYDEAAPDTDVPATPATEGGMNL